MRQPQPEKPTYGLEVVARFPRYTSRDDYFRRRGVQAPPFDSTRFEKQWEDLQFAGVPDDDQVPYQVAYLANGGIKRGPDGLPIPVTLNLMPSEASTVNLPPPGTFPAGVVKPGERQMPIELLENERLEQQPGIAASQLRVRRVDIPDVQSGGATTGGFTEVDRATLQAIQRDVRALLVGKQ